MKRTKVEAFTLIEMVGVLVILSILAVAVLSTTTRSIDVAVAKMESATLVNFATAFQNSALRNRIIPGATGTNNWVQAISSELGLSPFTVNTNSRNLRRVLMVDGGNSFSLPYSQGIGGAGSNAPTFRVMILSTMGLLFPNALSDGETRDFNAIWNAADGTRPVFSTNPLNTWAGAWEDIVVKRIDLGPSFLSLTLWNYPPPGAPQGRFQIDRQLGGSSTNNVPAGGTNSYFMTGTILSLLDSSTPARRQVDQILNRSGTFFYIFGTWTGTIDLGQSLGQGGLVITPAQKAAAAFSATAGAFVSAKYSTATATTPPVVLTSMSNFMSAYTNYSRAGFPASGAIYTAAKTAQDTMIANMTALANGLPNSGGCSNAPVQ